MIIKTAEELAGMQEIGRICAITLKKMGEALQPGMTTKELDLIGAEILASYGAKSAPITCYDFPGHNCISVNEVVERPPVDISNFTDSRGKEQSNTNDTGLTSTPTTEEDDVTE